MHHPSKRAQRTRSPERGWSGDKWTRGPQLPKAPPKQNANELLAQKSRLQTTDKCYWLGRAACEATTASCGEGPEDRKQGIAVHCSRVARDAPSGQV